MPRDTMPRLVLDDIATNEAFQPARPKITLSRWSAFQAMPAAGFSHIINALKHRDFRVFMSGHVLSQTAMWMYRITVGWLTWELTHSATWLGLMGLADMSSSLFIGPITGALADRLDRLAIIRATQAGTAFFAFLTFLANYNGWITPEILFGLVVCFGLCISTNLPARLAIVPNLVGPENLHAGIAINSLVSNAGRFLGPALGGYLIYLWGVSAAFAACAVFFGIPAFTLWLIRAPRIEIEKSGKRLLTDVVDGISYAAKHAGIGPMMVSLIITAVFGKTVVYMFPAFASEVFNLGAEALAMLTGSVGVGAVLGGIYMARRPGLQGLTRIFVLSIAGVGIGLAGFSANTTFWIAVPLAGIIGGSLLVNGVAAQSLIQSAVLGAMRGRVASLYVMIQRGGQSVGSLVLGILADIVGLRGSIAIASVFCLCFWLWSMRRAKTMAKLMEP
ncbi:MAG: MFS transporter [Rhodospirillales bacterium]